jgi:hypothetical protein
MGGRDQNGSQGDCQGEGVVRVDLVGSGYGPVAGS